MKTQFLLCLFVVSLKMVQAQPARQESHYWNTDLLLTPYRLPPPPAGYVPTCMDLDKDGDVDVIKSISTNGVPIAWIDDDDDMKRDALEGDTDSDCLLIDRNRDGRYGALGDLIVDWIDTEKDNRADLQLVADYPEVEKEAVWPNGHYMWMLDTDKDNVFNYIDWNSFQLKAWEKTGLSDFLEDYSGGGSFMKVHAATNRIKDLRFNWENPFLFYDEDGDGLSEMAIRLANTPSYFRDSSKAALQQTLTFSQKIDWVSISVDLDNDSRPSNEFDYDFSFGFRGEGFGYEDQVHAIPNMRGLPAADTFFLDPRLRQISELVYPDHKAAPEFIFKKGKWDQVFFVYDEDDDCNRWERVEFYDPLNPFKTGSFKGGIDHHPQADVAGDRGEWDLDNSGKGKLYISRFDGKLHLYGAEWGAWRIDQTAYYYQGWDRSWLGKQPQKFATIKYEDGDGNGFIDKMHYDLDGDTLYESTIDFKALDIDDRCTVMDVSSFKYKDYLALQKKLSADMWQQAKVAMQVAEKYGLDLSWYARLMNASSSQLKYSNGYWLQFYLFQDLQNLFLREKNTAMLERLKRAYFSADWKSLLKKIDQ